MATRSSFWLLRRLRAAKGPIAFVDESFRGALEHQNSFYILAAVVIPKSKLFAVRDSLLEIVGERYFHAAEAGRKEQGRMLIRKLADYLARETKPVIVVIEQLSSKDRDSELARERATRMLWQQLSEHELYLTGTVVYERRMRRAQDESDLRIFQSLKRLRLPGSKLQVLGLASKNEPLLWAPDLVAWAFRQAYGAKNNSYFSALAKVAKIIRI